MGTNTGGTALDTIRPTVGGSTMGDRQAGDLELNAVDGGGGRHRNRLRVLEYCSRSEGDGVSSRGIDFGKVLGTLLNALGFHIGGDGVQDCQELGAIGGTVQEGGSEVAGHGRMLVCGLERKGGSTP